MKKKKRRQSSGKGLDGETSVREVFWRAIKDMDMLDLLASYLKSPAGENSENQSIRMIVPSDEIYPIAILCEIHGIVERIASSTLPRYSVKFDEKKGRRIVESTTETELDNAFEIINAKVENYPSDLEPSELVRGFFEIRSTLASVIGRVRYKNDIVDSSGMIAADVYNLFIERMHDLTQTKEFKQRLRKRATASAKSFESASVYVNALFVDHKKLQIVRLNCFVSLPQSLKDAVAFRTKLINNRRSNQLFRGLVGHIWKLDYDFRHGYYFHFIFVFSDTTGMSSHELSSKIGEYWKVKLTEGKGTWCAPKKWPGSPAEMSLDHVGREDSVLRTELLKLFYYLTMKDQYIKFGIDRSGKRFGHGELKSSSLSDCRDVSICTTS